MNNKSIHDFRFFNFAIIDIAGTFLLGYIIYRYKPFYHCSFSSIMVILIVGAIITHYLLGIPTTLNNLLGLSDASFRSTNKILSM